MSSLSILDDDEHFKRCLDVFLKRLQTKETLTEWLYDNVFHDIQTKVISSVANSTKGNLRALGVGSGYGKTEDFFMSHFQPRFEQVYQRIVEPNKQLVQQHRGNVAKTGMIGITYDWRELTIEEYMKEAGNVDKFHFISSIHSVYHFSDSTLLGYLYDQLEENGVLLLVVTADSSINAQLSLGNSAIIPLEYSRYYFSISHVRDYFDIRGIPYDLYTREQKLDVSGCVEDNDKIQEENSLLLDFLTHVKDFCKGSLPESIKEKVFSTIRDCVKSISLEKDEAEVSVNVIVVQHKSIS